MSNHMSMNIITPQTSRVMESNSLLSSPFLIVYFISRIPLILGLLITYSQLYYIYTDSGIIVTIAMFVLCIASLVLSIGILIYLIRLFRKERSLNSAGTNTAGIITIEIYIMVMIEVLHILHIVTQRKDMSGFLFVSSIIAIIFIFIAIALIFLSMAIYACSRHTSARRTPVHSIQDDEQSSLLSLSAGHEGLIQ